MLTMLSCCCFNSDIASVRLGNFLKLSQLFFLMMTSNLSLSNALSFDVMIKKDLVLHGVPQGSVLGPLKLMFLSMFYSTVVRVRAEKKVTGLVFWGFFLNRH